MLRSLLLLIAVTSVAAARADDGEALARRVSVAAGIAAWTDVERVEFRWIHHPSGSERSYVWTPRNRAVEVITKEARTEVALDAVETDDQRRAHSAFVNDHYWMLFELRLAWDTGVEFDDLGQQPVPGLGSLGNRHALRVRYVGDGGYTPGDAYVLYLGDDDLPLAWAFHKGGAAEPSLVTTREQWSEVAGIHFPTRFAMADGSAFISIADVRIE